MIFPMIGTKGRLVDRVVEELTSLIVGGQLEPGTKLPPERELAEALGVSRTVLRESVRILMAKGLFEIRHGVGTIVRQMTTEQISEPLGLLAEMRGGISWRDLHQVRTILEIEVAGLAASNATDADIDRLEQLLADMDAHADDPATFAEVDADFHVALARITHNPILSLLVDTLRNLLRDYMTEVLGAIDPSVDVSPYHAEIVAAIQAGSKDQARQAMDRHLAQVEKNTLVYMAQQGRSSAT